MCGGLPSHLCRVRVKHCPHEHWGHRHLCVYRRCCPCSDGHPCPARAKPVVVSKVETWLLQLHSVSSAAFSDFLQFLKLKIKAQGWSLIFLCLLKAIKSRKCKEIQNGKCLLILLIYLGQITMFSRLQALISVSPQNLLVITRGSWGSWCSSKKCCGL